MLRSRLDSVHEILRNVDDVVYSAAPDGSLFYLSPNAERLFGGPVQGFNDACRSIIVPEDVPIFNAAIERCLKLGSDTVQFRVRLANGAVRWVESRKRLVCHGGPTRLHGVLRDITEQKDGEAVTTRLRKELSLKDEFLSAMSHELRTPLNAILGLTEALRDETFGPLLPLQKQKLQSIEESGKRLLSSVNDILDLASLRAGRLVLEKTRVSLRALCARMIARHARDAAQGGLSIEAQFAANADVVEADEGRLEQVMSNLISNAVKFSPSGGRIEVRTGRDGNRVIVEVADPGIGIAPEDLDCIFDPFTQVHRGLTRRWSGNGIGLALSHELVELHGGALAVRSTPGQGSTFAVTLPA